MNAMLCPAVVVLSGLVCGTVQALEANFKASFRVYGGPTDPPSVGYEVPTGGNYSYYTSREVADDVELGDGGRIIAGVSFEYYSNFALAGGLTFRMYERSGTGVPGTLIYSLPLDVLNGGGIVNINFNYDATNILPERFFYSVQFNGVGQGDVAGMIIPDAKAATGSSADQLLEKRGNAWLPIDLNAGRGRRIGFRRDGDGRKLRLQIAGNARTRIRIEAVRHLGQDWSPVGEVQTDDAGVAEFEQDTEEQDFVFLRTVEP